MAFCLPPKDADNFKRDIISGAIDPVKLAEMASEERHAFFAKRFGDATAGEVNRLFETKLLLKNQQAGMVNWAQRMMGSNKTAQRDVISRIERMKEILNPVDEKAFLEELASYKLGTRITYEEAKQITELAAKIDEARAKRDAGGDRMEYGRAVVALQKNVADLERNADKLTLAELKRNPRETALKALGNVASSTKALKASLDNSALFRQGLKTLMTHPGVWARNAPKSFADLVKAFGSERVMDEVNADIVSRPNYPLMKRAGLSVGTAEEAFPTSLPERIPGVGRLYRASEHAFTAFVQRTRADVFDKYIDIAEKSGVDLDKTQLQAIGKLTNSLTGRGYIGSLERVSGTVNNLLFSPRLLKSHLDTLLLHPTGMSGEMTRFTQKQAALNLLKIVSATAGILAVARAVNEDSVELDPRSADFGTIRAGNTRFDVTGGMKSLATLAARLVRMSSKSATTGEITELNSGKFGAKTGTDLVYDFFENKLSPAASVVDDLLRGETFSGEKPTLGNELKNLTEPITLTTLEQSLGDPSSANVLAVMLADSLGISVNTYGAPTDKRKDGESVSDWMKRRKAARERVTKSRIADAQGRKK